MGMPPSAAIYGGQPLPLGQPGPPGAPPGGPPGAPGRPARPPGNPPPLRGPGGIQKAGGLLAPRISGTQQQVARANWWNDETDVALRRLVGTHGRSWQYISELLGTGKTAKACESRFTRLEARDKKLAKGKGGMVPEKSPPWTAVEDGALRSIVQEKGTAWLKVAEALALTQGCSDREPQACRGRWRRINHNSGDHMKNHNGR